jgi:hypothetical protein
MAGTSFRVAAFLATVFLALAASEARAHADESSSGPENPAPEAPLQADATSVPSASAADGSVSADGSSGGAAVVAPEDLKTTTPASQQEEQVQPPASPSTPPPSDRQSAPTTPPDGGAGDPPGELIDEKPPATSGPQENQAAAAATSTGGSAVAASASGGDSPSGPAPESGSTSSLSPAPAMKLEAVEGVSPPSAGRPPGDEGLERLVSDVRRELRSVQGQIDDLQRRLDDGAPPPETRLVDLRTSLVHIAPMLVALEMRLEAAGRLSPHLRNLLRRVRSELRGARVTAAGLVVALRNSGARSAEVRLLIRELQDFGALGPVLAASPGVTQAPAAPSFSPSGAYTSVEPGPVAYTRQPSAASPTPSDAGPRKNGSHGGLNAEEPPPWTPSPGSATASPGGAFLFAGLASLTILLIGLALPALRALLELLPGRPYSVAFLEPLERPG